MDTVREHYCISPMRGVPERFVLEYFCTLHEADNNLLGRRLCDLDDPRPMDAFRMLLNPEFACFAVIDTRSHSISAEFTLENFTGMAAQIHFSMRPGLGLKETLGIGMDVTDHILTKWTKPPIKLTEVPPPYLQSLIGITPVSNRAACLFVLKTKFRKIGILPNAMTDRGNIVDAMITVKTREEVV